MDNCFDIILENEDYTMGKVIEYILYEKFYQGDKTLSFCGFKKMHPHDSESILRLSFSQPNKGISDIKTIIKHTIETAIGVFSKFREHFKK